MNCNFIDNSATKLDLDQVEYILKFPYTEI